MSSVLSRLSKVCSALHLKAKFSLIKCVLLVDVLHDVSRPGQLDLQLASMFHKEVHQRPGHRGRSVEEKRWDPQDGSVQLLQAEEKVVPVLHSQQIIVVFLQDAGVKGRHVGPTPNVLLKNLRWREVASEDKVVFFYLGPAARAGEDAAVPDDGADVVALVEDGRNLRQQRPEVLADGVDILVAGIVKVHQLADSDGVPGQREVTGDVDVLRNLRPARQRL